MQLEQTGMNIEDIVAVISKQDSIISLLKDIQNDWRISRALAKDPEDRLLIGTECIDEIISRIEGLENFRKQYVAEKKAQEEVEI